jgi:hypothetical protein
MVKPSKESENKGIGEDLCILAQLLASEGICRDSGALNHAGQTCSKLAENEQWTYSIGKLDFHLDEVGGTIPLETCEIILRFSISAKGKLQDSEVINDPLDSLGFDIEIYGAYYDRTENVRDMHCSWHFDRHKPKPEDGASKFSHPLYHFTFGGRKMEESALDYGSTLILPSPRFAYPPMDAVLGIDFIIRNYIHRDKTKTLFQNPDYVQIVRRSQARLWEPYAKSFYSHWDSKKEHTFEDGFDCMSVFPLYA